MATKDSIVSANVEFYGQIAGKYDRYEACASSPFFQRMLQNDIGAMAQSLENRFPKVRCLDCGGGSGNLTMKLLRRGWAVTVVDVSPEMLEISRAKVGRLGFTAEFINDSVENFLSRPTGDFEVVAFSSVLHHLHSPLEVVRKAAQKIRSGGFFYSNFDPAFPSSALVARWFNNFDTITAKLLFDRGDFVPGILRRLRKLAVPPDPDHGRAVVSPGDLAEYHARGLDDLALAKALQSEGFKVLRTRYAPGRTRMAMWINNRLGASLNFKLIAERK